MKETSDVILITDSTSMLHKSIIASQKCKVCGATALYTNFGIISCSSCKMFFKRNAELKQVSRNKCISLSLNTHMFFLGIFYM
jgi:ribosomal protein L37AE/L43A